MSSFDKDTKILVLGDKPLEPPRDKYYDSDQYRSYKKYLASGLEQDVRNVLLPALNTLLESSNISLDSHDSMIHTVKEVNYINHVMNTVKLSLLHKNAVTTFTGDNGLPAFKLENKKLNSFTLLELPYMDRSGILYNAGKTYVVINSLTLDNALTYDGSKLKFVDDGHSILFSGSVLPKMTMFGSSVTMVDFMIMLAKIEYGSGTGIYYSKNAIRSLRSPALVSAISGTSTDYATFGSDTFEFTLDMLTGVINDQRASEFGITDKIDAGYLGTNTTRRYLNDLLSFKNAIGRTISRDVVTDNGITVVTKGERITDVTVSRLNSHFIDTIHVSRSANLVGMYIASPIFLGNKIMKGMPVIPQMVELIPELEGYDTVPSTYDLKEGQVLMIDKNLIITEQLCTCLEYAGIEYFEYKEKLVSKKTLKAYFEEEYINNRHFPLDDIDISDKGSYDGYVYVDINGDIQQEQTNMTCHDVAALLSLFLKLQAGNHYDLFSDPDSGLRKRVEQCSDHFHKAFQYATTNLVKRGGAGLKKVASISMDLNDSDKMNKAFRFFSKDFFRCLYSVLKVIDSFNITNPVASISSLTKINTIVKNDDSISDSMRRLTMPHYGRICPYETPQSKKLGVVNNMAVGCIIEDGIMYTTYYKLSHYDGKTVIGTEPIRMSATEEEKYRIADISKLEVHWDTREVISSEKILARVPSFDSLEKVTIALIDLEDVQYVNTSTNQHASIACTTVPYAGSDDAARVSFGMSMVKQAKGLVNGETPIVCTTGFRDIVNMNTFYKIFAEGSGRVDVVSSTMVVVRYDGEKEPVKYDFEPMTLSSTSAIVRVSEVQVGDRVSKGQTLVSSNFIKDGLMVIGVNALVAIMTDGYNYEDGTPGSFRLASKMTSYGVHTDTFPVSKNSIRANVKDIRYENYIAKEDKLGVRSERLGKTTEYSTSVLRSERCRGFIAGVDMVRDSANYNRIKEIKVRSVSFDEFNKSDKICNRHGNKGVLCKLYKNSEMFYLENGEFMDIMYNPNGIVSRMNIGQLNEGKLGIACYVLGIQVMCDSFNSPSTSNITTLLSYAVDLANSDDTESVISKYSYLPSELHDHCRSNITRIKHWKGTFNKQGKAFLIDPVSGKRTLTRVNIGVNYVYKLVQEGELKLHSRGGFMTSPYVAKTESPTKGAANYGAQRMGYMELDAMAQYGAENLLLEVTNERCDNYIARNNATVGALHSGETDYMLNEKYGIRRSTEWMLQLLKALGGYTETTNNELDLTHPEERKYYKKRVLMDATFDGDTDEENIEAKMFDAFKSLNK